jgi:outer membrane protein assembly factor BamD (BamD/ComL family)
MTEFRTRAVVLVLLAVAAPVAAQPGTGAGTGAGTGSETEAEAAADESVLQQYLDALAQRRLIAAETGSVERLREIELRGEELYYEERYDESALLLWEVAESPRFADFVDLPEFRGAEYMLAGALQELGALRSAARYLGRILERGQEDPYFAPAYRRYVDVALDSGNLAAAIARLEQLESQQLPEDARNELLYLRARARYDAGELAAAEPILAEITQRSRFFAPAQYFRGVIAVRAGELDVAEEHFCSVATTGDRARASFVVDDRYFEVKDLARLALGRVAHEGRRGEDAFYYYFQVPADSDRVAEALFEAAYAMYESGDFDTSIDLLDQLAVAAPNSPYVDEATLLRGYVHLGRCEFEEANALFVRFTTQFDPIRRELDAILASPARRERLYEEMLTRGDQPRGADGEATAHQVLLALLRVDPSFHRLHAEVRTLDAEAARSGRVREEIDALLARVQGGDRPRAAAEVEELESDEAILRRDVEAARAVLQSLTEQIDAMRLARAPAAQLAPLENEMRQLGRRLDALERTLGEALQAAAAAPAEASGSGAGVDGLLRRDLAHARRMPARVSAVRSRLIGAANDSALRAVQTLRGRIASGVRRARIGRIDAVMGSKRRIEIQIESLAAGRFPPELMDPLRVQGLLRDDEEYWPFEGEDWPDEYEQQEADEDEPAEAAEAD